MKTEKMRIVIGGETSDATECKRCGRYYDLRENSEPTRFCDECAHWALDWIWENCRIVFWPGGDGYPIEHNMDANKDSRDLIEAEMHGKEMVTEITETMTESIRYDKPMR